VVTVILQTHVHLTVTVLWPLYKSTCVSRHTG